MIRKLALSAIVVAGTLTGLTLTAPRADAQPLSIFHRRFEVLVWCGNGWECRGTYKSWLEARRVARHLRHEGLRVDVRRV